MLAKFFTLAANLVPLIGVWSWDWDAFQVLIIYWAETIVIGGWALARIATLPPQYLGTITINGREQRATNRTMTGFFAANAGGSAFAHLFFLCALFFKDWPSEVRGPISFITEYFGHASVWSVLVLAFLSGLASFAMAMPCATILDEFDRKWHGQAPVPVTPEKAGANTDHVGLAIADLYKRIFVMQVGLIAGAWFAQSYGSKGALMIVIVLKTLIDLGSRSSISPVKMTFSNGGKTVSIRSNDPESRI